MRTARQFLTVALLLVSYLTPAMACMVSSVQMTAEERACCQAMQNNCEQMGMTTSHGCCQKAPHSALENALTKKQISYHPIVTAVVWLMTAEWFRPTLAATGQVAHIDYSPPQSPPSSISVLRI